MQFINIHKLVHNVGKLPLTVELSDEFNNKNRNKMIVHDLKIIAISIGFFQYSCLLAGCVTVRFEFTYILRYSVLSNLFWNLFLRLFDCNARVVGSCSIQGNKLLLINILFFRFSTQSNPLEKRKVMKEIS